jgi:hypothetical protein
MARLKKHCILNMHHVYYSHLWRWPQTRIQATHVHCSLSQQHTFFFSFSYILCIFISYFLSSSTTKYSAIFCWQWCLTLSHLCPFFYSLVNSRNTTLNEMMCPQHTTTNPADICASNSALFYSFNVFSASCLHHIQMKAAFYLIQVPV